MAPLPALMPNSMPPSFEGGPGGAGSAGKPVLVAEDDLAVGAYVEEKGGLAPLEHAGAEDSGYYVSAHVGGDGREGEGVHMVAEFHPEARYPYGREEGG